MNLAGSQHGVLLQDATATGKMDVIDWGLFRKGQIVCKCLGERGVCLGKLEHFTGHWRMTMGGALLSQTPLI